MVTQGSQNKNVFFKYRTQTVTISFMLHSVNIFKKAQKKKSTENHQITKEGSKKRKNKGITKQLENNYQNGNESISIDN